MSSIVNAVVDEIDSVTLTETQVQDAINVYSINEIEGDTRYVSISGHVKRPGTYELFESLLIKTFLFIYLFEFIILYQ